MGGESLNSPEKLKEYMDSLFDFSTKLPYQKFHLITSLQASKSLIGINPNNPPKTILKWIESYISTFTLDFEDEKQKNDKVKLEVITIEKFTSAVSKNEKLLALDYIEHLFQVASPQYLSEYILELSLDKSISHTLFCWYIYKSLKNIKYERQLHLLKLGVSALFDSSLNLKDSEFIILCVFREILDTVYIRLGTFSTQLLTLLEAARKKCEQKGSYFLEKKNRTFYCIRSRIRLIQLFIYFEKK